MRYLYSAPLALGTLAFLIWGTGRQLPLISAQFLGLVTIAGIAQIFATSLMIHSFSLRNYTVGTVYSKTETLFVALFATFIAGEPLKFGAWMGILVCLGSAGFALAMTLENAALVRAAGQIELVFTFIASHVVLKERPSLGEWIGGILVVGGVVLILVVR